jgi:hypothetical protein
MMPPILLSYCDATYLIIIIFIKQTISRLQVTFLFNPATVWPEVTLVNHRLGRPYYTGRVRRFRLKFCAGFVWIFFSIISKKGLRSYLPRFERKRKWAAHSKWNAGQYLPYNVESKIFHPSVQDCTHCLSRLFSTGCTIWDCSLRQLKYFIRGQSVSLSYSTVCPWPLHCKKN